MAHGNQISALIGQLVKSIKSNSLEHEVNAQRSLALDIVAKAGSGRVNQFEVTTRLKGLEEKARILNHDSWADALHDRLQELSLGSDTWTPEVLSLLLQLSDRPTDYSSLRYSTPRKPSTPPDPLTWSDIIADDPLDDQDPIWQFVDFKGGESDDEVEFQSQHEDVSETTTEFHEPPLETTLEDFIESHDSSKFLEVVNAQFWKTVSKRDDLIGPVMQEINPSEMLLTEPQAIRETIFMLLGLPTSLYVRTQMNGITLFPKASLRHMSPESASTLLASFADIGNKLLYIRQWIQTTINEVPLMETFQAAIASRLNYVDDKLITLQARMIHPDPVAMVTLLSLYEEVFGSSRFLLQVNDFLIGSAELHRSEMPFRILEQLFDSVCSNQMIGDPYGYQYMANLFFECFQTYLRPIRLWMEEGQLDKADGVMFIEQNDNFVPLSSLWRHRHYLIKDSSGNLRAPAFLHLSASKIFNSGKCIEFLRHLGLDKDVSETRPLDKPVLNYEYVCRPAELGVLSPFPELFDMAFDRWIASMHDLSSSMLREQLETGFGMQRSFDALEHLYFCRNGALSDNILIPVIERLERGDSFWNDSFIITELIQNTYRTLSCIDVEHINVRTSVIPSQRGFKSSRLCPMSLLKELRIEYILPWPIANVISPESIRIYQRIFVLLIQLQRARSLLQCHLRPDLLPAGKHSFSILICQVRHRLLWFTNTMLTYITHMVLAAATARMRSSMKLAMDVDTMIELHDTYIAQLEHQCFLDSQQRPTRQAIVSVLDLTVLFSDICTPSVKLTDVNAESQVRNLISVSKESIPQAEDGSSDERAFEADLAIGDARVITSSTDMDRLRSVNNTFSKLGTFITAAIHGVSKADSSLCFELLANNLTAGFKA